MKRNILLLFYFLITFICKEVFSQTPNFCNAWKVTNGGSVVSSTTDAAGNYYITGYFWTTTIIGNDTLVPNSEDMFVVKYDSLGNALWAKSAGGGGNNTFGNSLDVDNDGNVYVTGEFGGDTIFFGNYFILNTGPNGYYNIYLVKYDSVGNFLWAKSAGGLGPDLSKSVSLDDSGGAYITGYFNSAFINFDTITLYRTPGSVMYDIFIAKYDSSGNAAWAKGAFGKHWEESQSINVDVDNNIYITGHSISDTLIFDTDSLINTGGGIGVFIVKYNSNGNVIWANNEASNAGFAQCYSIASDSQCNIFITGFFANGIVTFGNDTLWNTGAYDIFIAKYDSAGNALWAKSAGGLHNSSGTSVCADISGNVYLTGAFNNGTIQIGNYILTTVGPSGDVFIAKYDPLGYVLWAKSAGGPSLDNSKSVTTDAWNNVYIAGFFQQDTVSFDGILLYGVSPANGFVAKICGTTTGIQEIASPNSINIFPNPTSSSFNIKNFNAIELKNIFIYNTLGEKVKTFKAAKTIFIGDLSKGLYLVQVMDDGGKAYTQKVILE